MIIFAAFGFFLNRLFYSLQNTIAVLVQKPNTLKALHKMTTVNDRLIAVQTKLAASPKFGRLRGSTSASLKIGEILAIREKLASFGNVRSHLFCSTC